MDQGEAQELLKVERERIEGGLAGLARAERGEQSEPGEVYEATLDAGMRDQLEEELQALERAEQRLADGTYGLSVESGDPIPDARLRIQPTAERTVDEQQRYAR